MIYIKNQVHAALDLLMMHSALPNIKTERAERYLYAIGYKESRFRYRKQIPQGPARGFWQFEKDGIRAVLRFTSEKSPNTLVDICHKLRVELGVEEIYQAITYNDVLAAVMARLLLYSHPNALPPLEDLDASFKVYLQTWRPGVPASAVWEKAVDFATKV